MEDKIHILKIKKARLVDQLKMLSSVDDKFYIQMGKIESEIILLEHKLIQQIKNTFDED